MAVYYKGNIVTPIIQKTTLFRKLVDRSITEVTAEDLQGVTSIGSYAFLSCNSLTSIEIPSSVTSIGSSAFQYCSSLTNIELPSSLTSISDYAFRGCSSLTIITINSKIPPTLSNANAFDNTNNCPIYVPAESVETYKTATNWSSLASRIQAIPE